MATKEPARSRETPDRLDRREFVRGTLRYTSLAAVLAAIKLARSPRAKGKTCARLGLCAGCSLLARCELPPAIIAQKTHSGVKP